MVRTKKEPEERALAQSARARLRSADGWRLVWRDEFEADGPPDPARWGFQTDCNGWHARGEGNAEAQWYTAGRRENAWVRGGRLRVTARRELPANGCFLLDDGEGSPMMRHLDGKVYRDPEQAERGAPRVGPQQAMPIHVHVHGSHDELL